jgi:hypothetical protein
MVAANVQRTLVAEHRTPGFDTTHLNRLLLLLAVEHIQVEQIVNRQVLDP